MKKIIFIVVFLILVPVISVCHEYLNGKVEQFSPNLITINTGYKVVSYPVALNVSILKHTTHKGAFFEEPAKSGEIKENKFVTIKIENGIVTEIIIEDY